MRLRDIHVGNEYAIFDCPTNRPEILLFGTKTGKKLKASNLLGLPHEKGPGYGAWKVQVEEVGVPYKNTDKGIRVISFKEKYGRCVCPTCNHNHIDDREVRYEETSFVVHYSSIIGDWISVVAEMVADQFEWEEKLRFMKANVKKRRELG